MKRSVLSVLAVALVFAISAPFAFAQSGPEFKLGFKALADQIPNIVGQPTENEHFNISNGNSEQHTTTGLMVWRKADNWTAFTNGNLTWLNGPAGLVSRFNNLRYCWEADANKAQCGVSPNDLVSSAAPAPAVPAVTAAPPAAPTPAPTAAPAKTLPPDVVAAAESFRTVLAQAIRMGIAPTPQDLALACPELSGHGVGDQAELARELAWTTSLFGSGMAPAPSLGAVGVVESQIDGEFNGWSGDTIFKLMNGQIWQQASPDVYIYIAVYPNVVIYPSDGRYKMQVDGVSDTIYVVRLK